MTLNLRRDLASDGANRWALRRGPVARLLAREAPHVLATQEGLAHQLGDLDAALPRHRRVGRCRRGDGSDEHVAIHYDAGRLLLVAWGDLWLSDSPESPGSASWGNRLPRMVTWARFTDQETCRSFTLANTHLDHESAASRERAARFLHGRFPGAVLVGDFNEAPGGEVHRLLTRTREDALGGAGGGTYHGFTGRPTARLDWILVPLGIRGGRARVLDARERGRWVSDHFPVAADVALAGPLPARSARPGTR